MMESAFDENRVHHDAGNGEAPQIKPKKEHRFVENLPFRVPIIPLLVSIESLNNRFNTPELNSLDNYISPAAPSLPDYQRILSSSSPNAAPLRPQPQDLSSINPFAPVQNANISKLGPRSQTYPQSPLSTSAPVNPLSPPIGSPTKKKSPTKRKRKEDDLYHEDRPVVQKMTKFVKARLQRGLNDPIYLAKTHDRKELEQVFEVFGTTGNIYKVEISQTPSCNCIDYKKGNHYCKHLFFVFLKVLKVSQDVPQIYQHRLLPDEVRAILANAPKGISPEVMAHQDVIDALKDDVRKPIQGECPICFREMKDAEIIVWCRRCGHNIHADCFAKWEDKTRQRKEKVTCVMCRADWSAASTSPVKVWEGYHNLAEKQPGTNIQRKVEYSPGKYDPKILY